METNRGRDQERAWWRLKRCCYCRKKFKSDPRLRYRQITCGSPECQRIHHTRYHRTYRHKNRQEELDTQLKQKNHRRQNYWKDYRRDHPEYVARERSAARVRKQRAKNRFATST